MYLYVCVMWSICTYVYMCVSLYWCVCHVYAQMHMCACLCICMCVYTLELRALSMLVLIFIPSITEISLIFLTISHFSNLYYMAKLRGFCKLFLTALPSIYYQYTLFICYQFLNSDLDVSNPHFWHLIIFVWIEYGI